MKKHTSIILTCILILSISSVAFVNAAVKVPTPQNVKLTKKASGTSYNLTAKANKVKGVTSYQAEWSWLGENNYYNKETSNTTPKFKAKFSSSAKQKCTARVHVRAVMKKNGKTYYSKWSSWKSVSIPKNKKAPKG